MNIPLVPLSHPVLKCCHTGIRIPPKNCEKETAQKIFWEGEENYNTVKSIILNPGYLRPGLVSVYHCNLTLVCWLPRGDSSGSNYETLMNTFYSQFLHNKLRITK